MNEAFDSSTPPPGEETSGCLVLVAEDEQIVAHDIQVSLQGLGYKVPLTVPTGERALAEAQRLRPDVIIMDIGLAGEIDGIEAARRLRDDFDLPVIFATAHSDDATLRRARLVAPFGYLLKPFDVRELRMVIETTIYKHRLDKQLRSSEERYRRLFQSSPMGILHFGPDLNLTEINERGASILGGETATLIGRPITTIVDPVLEPLIVSVLKGEGSTYHGPVRPITGESPLWVAVRTAPLYDRTGTVMGAMMIIEDTTGQHVVEEALVRRVALEDLIASSSARLVNATPEHARSEVERTLSEVGRFFEADRCFVLTFSPEPSSVEDVFEWCMEGAVPRAERFKTLPLESWRWTLDKLLSAEPVVLHCISALPVEAVGEQKFWSQEGTRSLLLLPLAAELSLVGAFGFVSERSERIWAAEDLRLLTVLGEILAGIVTRDRAISDLRRSEERYRNITTQVTDYMYTVGLSGGHWNETTHGPGCAVVTGYSEEEYKADPHLWLKMVDEQDRTAVMDQARRVLAGEPSPSLEHRILRKDGVLRWVRNTPVLHFKPDGSLASYDGLVQDITERREAEDALRRSEDRYRVLVENLNDVVFAVDSRGYFTYISQRIRELAGYIPEEIVGQHFSRFVHPHDRAGLVADWERTTTGRLGTYEFRIMTKQEDELYVRTSSRPRFEHGNLAGLTGIMTDCTDSRLAVETLRASEQRFRETLNSIPLAAALLDAGGAILFCNRHVEELSGRRRDNVIGRRWYDEFVPASDRDRIRAAFTAVAAPADGSARIPLATISHSDPGGRLEWSLSFFRSAEGNITGATCFGHPVKEG
jgi:PAS domain S-box-containing protein